MKISIVIPVYNGGDDFQECLRMIYKQKINYSFEIVCVDSGSRDKTVSCCRNYGVKLIQIPRKGFNHGLTRNLGINQAKGEYIVLINQDAIPYDEHWLGNLICSFDNNEKIAGVYSRQISKRDCSPFIKKRLKNWKASRQHKSIQAIIDLAEYKNLHPIKKLELICFDTVSCCIRKDVWERHPFIERNFGEDICWSKRVLEAGYEIAYEPKSAVIHSHNRSIWQEFKRVYLDHQNLNELIGISLVPALKDVFGFTVSGTRDLWNVLEGEGMNWKQKLYWKAYAVPFSFTQNLAQYLGAHSKEWLARREWFLIDKILTKGI